MTEDSARRGDLVGARRTMTALRIKIGLGVAAVLAVLLVPGVVGSVFPSPTGSTSSPTGLSTAGSITSVSASLVAGSRLAVTPGTFWGLNIFTTCSKCLVTNPAVGRYLNATHFSYFRDDPEGDSCNVTINTVYSDNGVASTPCAFNVGSLKTWCYSKTPHCHAIISLPGENNNSKEDSAIANYIVHTLGFQPTYWAIGNEPMGWTHYGIAWKNWRSTDHSVPSPLAYAFDVKAAIAAVKSVDTGAHFIGVQAACQCNTLWFEDLAKIDGPSLSMISYHTYPSLLSSGTTETLAQFYGALDSTHNLTTSYANVRADIANQCSSCGSLPISIGEYNAGPGWKPSNYAGTYANAVFLAASTVQALRANVTQLDVYDLQSDSSAFGYSMLNSNSLASPSGKLYTHLLNHLATGAVYGVGVKSTASNVWALLTKNGTRHSLMIVNANLTHSLLLSIGTVLPVGAAATVYSWAPGQSVPQVGSAKILSSYSVPSQGILLIDF